MGDIDTMRVNLRRQLEQMMAMQATQDRLEMERNLTANVQHQLASRDLEDFEVASAPPPGSASAQP
jgi:hypothetical protein